jgi:hypothetical protein
MQQGACFVVQYLGYLINGTQTTVAFKVTNNCRNGAQYVAIGTAAFTRMAPADGSVYSGSLGTYNVAWTAANGNPGFTSIRFTPTFRTFSNGATDTFAVVVSGFNPNTAVQVQGKAGNTTDTLSFILSTPCPPSGPTLAMHPPGDFTGWLNGSWNRLVAWLSPNALAPRRVAAEEMNSLSNFDAHIKFERMSDDLPAISRDGTLNWQWVRETSASERSEPHIR